MFDEMETLTIKTVGAYFSQQVPSVGVWTAGLVWNDDEVGPTFDLLTDRSHELENKGHNIGADVFAVLAGLRKAQSLKMPAQIHSVNESVIKTIPEWFDSWERNGWKTGGQKTPDCLEEWKEIKAITEQIHVTWHKRPKGKVDTVKDYLAFDAMVEKQDNDFWMQRAIDRDPY